jgi:hypothetical protein
MPQERPVLKKFLRSLRRCGFMVLGWIEVDIGLKRDVAVMEGCLLQIVLPLIQKHTKELTSWHFLWEEKPWPQHRGEGITLFWRLYGDQEVLKKLRDEIDTDLSGPEKRDPGQYLGHCYGKHGDCQSKDPYEGEAECWGTGAWAMGVRFMQLGSEIALRMVEIGGQLGHCEEWKKGVEYYADRWCHLFMT